MMGGGGDPILHRGDIIVETELLLRLAEGPFGGHIPIGNKGGSDVRESNFKLYYLGKKILGQVFYVPELHPRARKHAVRTGSSA